MKFVGTLENLCKLLWRQDRKRDMDMVADGETSVRSCLQQFEREDAEPAAREWRAPAFEFREPSEG
jgi:hypothetical protein